MAGIIKPKALTSGDTVSVVAPSEPITRGQKDAVGRFFEKFKYKVKFGEGILSSIGDYAAGTATSRAADINAAFADKEVSGVFAAVGGTVASQVLEKLDFDMICKNPKVLAGYSDTTTLQMAILAKCGLVTFHSPNASYLPGRMLTGYTIGNFWKVLTTKTGKVTIEPQSTWQQWREGAAEGILFGGNLTCICKLLGTPWDPIAALPKIFGKDAKFIFFWEEVEEQFSTVMRNLWQIRNTGFLNSVSAMMIGKLNSVKEVDYQRFPTKRELVLDLVAPYSFPVIAGVDFGHEVPQMTIPIGVAAGIDSKKMKLEILEPAVV